VLNKDECLFRDDTSADYMYLLVKGRLRVEKEVDVSAANHWPLKEPEKELKWVERRI
jgi:hypothetical protein